MHRACVILVVLSLLIGYGLKPVQSQAKPSPRKRSRSSFSSFSLSPLPSPRFSLPNNNMSCYRMVRQHTRKSPIWVKRYPATVEQATSWLKAAIKSKSILWQRGRLLAHLQTKIDNHRFGRMFLLFGNNHSIVEHYRFFNELWHPGKDGIKLDGVTHIALEAFVTGMKHNVVGRKQRRKLQRLWRKRLTLRSAKARFLWRQRMLRLLTTDQQPLMDMYLRYGDRWALQMLEVINHFMLGSSYPPEMLHEIHATLKHVRKYQGNIKVIASDMAMHLRKQAKRLLCWIYPLREMFSLHVIKRHLRSRRSVVAYMWGADHIRKDHFPRFLSPTDKVVSVRLAGGGAPDIWDMAMARMGIQPKLFAIPTPGSREGDFLIHLPPRSSLLARALLRQYRNKAQIARVPRHPLLQWKRKSVLPTYTARVNRSLQRLRFQLRRCAWKRKTFRGIQVQLEISGAGQIEGIQFPRRQQLRRWQERCIRRLLWKRTLEAPPNQETVNVLFQLRFVY